MSTQRIVINLPETADQAAGVAPAADATPAAATASLADDIYRHVIDAAEAEESASAQTQQLQHELDEILAPNRMSAIAVGKNCIEIYAYDELIPEVLTAINPTLLRYRPHSVLDMEQLVWTYGDESPEFEMFTSRFQAPWASVRSIPGWIRYITNEAKLMAEMGIGEDPRDFIVIRDLSEDELFIQCYYNTAADNYRVEMRLGDADNHYATDIADADSVIQTIINWMTGSEYSTDGWEKMNF